VHQRLQREKRSEAVVTTLIIAIVGAATGVASLAWNIISSRREGPIIKIRATCSGRGDEMKVSGLVSNAGRFDANLESVWFGWPSAATSPSGGGRSMSGQVPTARIAGIQIPGPMPAESGQEFTITGIDKIDPGLSVALHDRRQVALVVRTASGKRGKKYIKYT
jgi:hypothetical protein